MVAGFGQPLAGTLDVTPSGGTLSLIEESSSFPASPAEPAGVWIHGELHSGQHVTLPVAYRTARSYGDTANGVGVLTYSCPQVLIGSVSYAAAPVVFDAVRLELKWLGQWLGQQVVKSEFIEQELRFTVGDRQPEAISVKLPGGETFRIFLLQEGWVLREMRGVLLHQVTALVLVPEEPRALQWFLEQERQLWQLISLITGWESEVTMFKGLCLRRNAESGSAGDEGPVTLPRLLWADEVEGHFAGNSFSPAEETMSREMLLTVAADSPSLASIVPVWYTWDTALHQVVGLLLAATREDDYYLESRLVNLAQALEAAHRALYPQETAMMSKLEFGQLHDDFSKWVQRGDAAPYAKELTGRFGNLNSISFQTRLEHLLGSLWEPFLRNHCGDQDLKALVRRIAGNRNAVSHGRVSGSISEQRELVDLMGQSLRIILLQQLGWTAPAAVSVVSAHRVSLRLNRARSEAVSG